MRCSARRATAPHCTTISSSTSSVATADISRSKGKCVVPTVTKITVRVARADGHVRRSSRVNHGDERDRTVGNAATIEETQGMLMASSGGHLLELLHLSAGLTGSPLVLGGVRHSRCPASARPAAMSSTHIIRRTATFATSFATPSSPGAILRRERPRVVDLDRGRSGSPVPLGRADLRGPRHLRRELRPHDRPLADGTPRPADRPSPLRPVAGRARGTQDGYVGSIF